MNSLVLRVEGDDAALESLRLALTHHIGVKRIDATWRKGEARRRGGVHSRAGFNSCIAEEASSIALVEATRSFLHRCQAHRVDFSSTELAAQVDLGLAVGGADQFTSSVRFSPADLGIFAELGLGLTVSVYPVGEE